jgi:hypothetical protein
MSKHRSVRAFVLLSLLAIGVAAIVGKDVQDFRIRDDCDAATFNATFGDGTCIGDGDTTVEEFLEELQEDKEVGSWRFNPDETRLDRGQGTVMESRGGEFHTFTRVERFGGGIIPELNDLTGAGDTRPECGTPFTLAPNTLSNIWVPAGANITGPVAGETDLPKGTSKWQCCIHPWMRSEVTVR